ncbi:hypothetical protein [Mycobacterium sp.]|uniref:hypothetical protein n=1 Tax=Mycobacterium sp. TaxID=1785 RepID=UPI00262FAB8D|nr:hypothetical protein [Mycobacterium sp.]
MSANRLCLKPGLDLATPTFTPLCTLPEGHADPCNWRRRMALRNQLRQLARDPGDDPRERHGAGVCMRGTCIEPCGPNGGCIR